MKCKSCKNEIPDGSIFCMFCGEKQIKEKKKKDEIKVPKPTQLPSGKWNIYLRAEGQSITEDSSDACILKARAIRAGFIEAKKSLPKLTLEKAIADYISMNDAVLSPATLYGYEGIRQARFISYQDKDLSSVNWQKAINEEAKLCGAKTLKNAWGLVARVMRSNGLEVPEVKLPQIERQDRAWLDFKQIQAFLETAEGQSCEIASLLALHSLRRSELYCITPSKIQDGVIHVHGALVPNQHGEFVMKSTNKNQSSTRNVPIMIPRLQTLIDESAIPDNTPLVTMNPNATYKAINSVCRKAGVPEVGLHGLRRSFASLAYHLGWSERQTMAIGGWSDYTTMHKIYIKLGQDDIADAANKMKDFYKFTDDFTDEVKKS